ncbi:MAG: NAD(P)H-hydrate dehydratase [Kiritimatiellia bacterium]|nr:NAD(P)H-hydrate dehydratase [Kiritimatiellia bacterium]
MKIVSTDEIKKLDRLTIEQYGVPDSLLMERAGSGVAAGVIRLFREYNLSAKKVLLVAGKGNNGGDAFVVARILKEQGFNPLVLLAGEKKKLHGAALFHFKKMAGSKVVAREIRTEKEWHKLVSNAPDGEFSGYSIVVDGILGTGLKGEARGAAVVAIRLINALSKKCKVVSIDIPSGLDSDTGVAEGDVVRADLTMTMGLPKKGLVEQDALEYVGQLEVVDIGFPAALVDKIKSDLELITPADLAPLFPRRNKNSHKGNYGHLLIMGGAEGYSGAMTLAALAAVRSGIGLVTVVVPERLVPFIAVNVPEAMVHGAPETESGSLDSICWEEWRKRLDEFGAILAGPGMTRHSATRRLVEMILRDSKIPVVLDADALNVFEGEASELSARRGKLVITPHPGEMARLLGVRISHVQSNRVKAALQASTLADSTTVLKGAGTLVAEKNGKIQINMTGNPGMSAGGMGDVLAGLLGGLLAQGMKPFDAARAAVYLHGRAGDLAAAQSTEQTLIARDLITSFPHAFREISGR